MAVNPDIIAHGKVVIEVAENIQRDMAKAEAEVERGMRRLERKEAELKITADDRSFVNKMRAAQARAEKSQQDLAKATDANDRKNSKARLARANATLKALENGDVKLYNKLVQLDEDRAKLQEGLQRRAADNERKLSRAIAKEQQQRTDNAKKQAREQTRQHTREVNLRIKESVREAKEQTRVQQKAVNDRIAMENRARASLQRQRQQAMRQVQADMERSAELQARYIDLQERRQKAALKRSKLFTSGQERVKVDVDMARLDRQIADVRARLEAIDEPPPEINLEIDDRGSKALSRWAHLISDTSVRMGPFTTSIGGATRALALFGPVITGVAGALGALAGALGSAAFGGLATLTAGTLGFGAALGGVGFLIPSLLRDFKSLNTLQKAYHTQVLKTGANSDKAKNKLKEFKNALGEVSPTARAAFESVDKLQDRWRKLSKQARPVFLEDVAAATDMANNNFRQFSEETLQSFDIVSDGWKSLMRALQSDEALTSFQTLSDNAQESMPAFGRGLAVIGRAIVRIGVNASRYLPDLADGFERWANGITGVTNNQDDLTALVDQSVSSMRSLGHFTQSATNFLIAFFGRGVEPGVGLIDRMTGGLDRMTAKINANPDGLESFFGGSVETTEDLWEAIVPLAKLFMEWATIMRPFTTAMLAATEAISGIVDGIASFAPIKNFLTVAFGVFLAGSLAGKIMAVVGAMRALATSVTAVGTANAGARIADMATGGGLGFAARQQRKAGGAPARKGPTVTRGPSGAISGVVTSTALAKGLESPAAKATGRQAIKGLFTASIRGAGLLGLGIMASDLLMKGLATAGVRKSGESTVRGIGQDFMHTLTLGMADSADEASAKAFPAAIDAVRRNLNAEIKGKLVDKGPLHSIYAEDLTDDQRKFVDRFRSTLREAHDIAVKFRMPELRASVKIDADPQDFKTLNRNFSRLKNGLVSNVTEMRQIADQNLRAIEKTMGTHSAGGRRAVVENMDLTAKSIGRSMKNGTTNARDGMRAIRQTFQTNSRAAKETTASNFEIAKRAIKDAVHDGVISSKRGTREIKRLWVENLKMYGFTESAARNIQKGNSYIGGPEEGTRGPGKARGGLINVGRPGKRAHDRVPAMLNGQPAVVAEGEQVAVFNRHQQRAMNTMLPGGLSGFFGKNKRPHYAASGGLFGENYAGGGIVPVPGFPGESAAASVIPMIEFIAKRFALTLTDAFGTGHQSPGHTVTGTAADFDGPDANMDAAVKYLVGKGYLVGYDGRFGSQDWPGHGPSTRTANHHFHVELAGGGGGAMLEAPSLKRVLAPGADRLGAVGAVAQGMVDSVRAAAQANLQKVYENVTTPVAGGVGGVSAPGAGAATRAQMVAWASQALRMTGVGATPGNIAKILELSMKESSWVVDSINNWDSNAAAGNPSGGLMHVTLDKVGGSMAALFDPIKNIVASIRYQLSRYGHLITFSPYAMGGIADKFQTMTTGKGGGVVRRPTLMMGEEPAKEFVISTNSAYKKSNQARLAQAAQALGVPQAAKGYTPSLDPPPKHPDQVPKYKRHGKMRPKRRKRAKRLGRAWNTYIDKLQSRKDDLEQEVSYREGKLEEPSDLMVEDGRIIQKDPETGADVDYGPRMVINTKAIEDYKAQITSILDAYNPLRGVTTSLWTDIPKAMTAFHRERKYRKDTIAHLKDAIRRDENRVGKKHISDEARKNSRQRLSKNRKRLGQEQAVIDDIDADLGSLGEDRKDAGFDIRTYNDDIRAYREDRDSIDAKAKTETDTANAEEVKDGPDTSGGGAGTGNTMQMQQLMADTERGNILREFQGNVNQAVEGIAGASGGLQTNLSGGLGAAAATAGLNAVAAAVGGGAGGGALMRTMGANLAGSTAGAMMAGSGAISSGGAFGAGAVDNSNRSVTINNTFAAPPEDPMTWTKGVMFEAQAAV